MIQFCSCRDSSLLLPILAILSSFHCPPDYHSNACFNDRYRFNILLVKCFNGLNLTSGFTVTISVRILQLQGMDRKEWRSQKWEQTQLLASGCGMDAVRPLVKPLLATLGLTSELDLCLCSNIPPLTCTLGRSTCSLRTWAPVTHTGDPEGDTESVVPGFGPAQRQLIQVFME